MVSVAIVGATGVVGETILRVLEERAVPLKRLAAFASRARSGAVRFRDRALDVQAAGDAALRDYDVVFFAGSEDASERYASPIVARGGVVIDNSPAYRLREDVPLVIPEVNAAAVRPEDRIFPVANCTAIILCMALAPVAAAAGLRTVRVATYQAASGAGRAGLDELIAQEKDLGVTPLRERRGVFPAVLARNVIPQVGAFDCDGFSGEERKVAEETRKILGLGNLMLTAMCVRVPVHTAHSEAVFFETEGATTVEQLAQAFEGAPGVAYHRDGIVTPRDVEGTDLVHVVRLRAEDDAGRNFALWCAGDQLRKGAATNAVQILQLLLERGMVGT